jgi:hypothetical protein
MIGRKRRMVWRILGGVVGVLLLTAVSAAYYFLNTFETPAVDPAWALPGNTEPAPGAVTVRWTGAATLVFSDVDTTLIIDGWFSRPGPLSLVSGTIEPDVARSSEVSHAMAWRTPRW